MSTIHKYSIRRLIKADQALLIQVIIAFLRFFHGRHCLFPCAELPNAFGGIIGVASVFRECSTKGKLLYRVPLSYFRLLDNHMQTCFAHFIRTADSWSGVPLVHWYSGGFFDVGVVIKLRGLVRKLDLFRGVQQIEV